MPDPTYVSELQSRGTLAVPRGAEGSVELSYSADFSGPVSLLFDFTLLQNANTFSVPRTLFIDNSLNPSQCFVSVSQTGQKFPWPAFTAGYLPISAQQNSTITVETDGGVPGGERSSIELYNYRIPPIMWNGFGPYVPDLAFQVNGANDPNEIMSWTNPLAVSGIAEDGVAFAGQRFLPMMGIDRDANVLRGLKVDALGRLDFSGASITLGGVYGADPNGSPPVNPGLNLSLTNEATGNLVWIKATANAEVRVHDAEVKAELVAANVLLGALETLSTAANALLTTIDAGISSLVSIFTRPATGAMTSVASSATDVTVLAANANRKGGSIYNESTAPLRIILANVVADATHFSVIISAGGYYEIPFGYTGIIRGYWEAVNGSARVTEIV